MKERKDGPDANARQAEIEAKLRQLADYRAKGLIRAEEADAQQQMLQKRLLETVMPDAPLPRPPARARLQALGGMAAVVAVVGAWLLWGNAGLQPRTVAMLRMLAARADAASSATTAAGGTPSASGAPMSQPSSAASAASSAAVDPNAWVSGRLELSPALRRRVEDGDALFITLRHPGEAGLPLAAVRKRADDLPMDFSLGPKDALGDPARVTAASAPVVVEARISRSGRGLPSAGDLESDAPPAPLGSTGVRVIISRVR